MNICINVKIYINLIPENIHHDKKLSGSGALVVDAAIYNLEGRIVDAKIITK